MNAVPAYTTVCALADLDPECGLPALVGGRGVAVFRLVTDEVLVLDNYDPFSKASVLARGIVGTTASTATGATVDFVASPMHKQRFDLRTGRCLDDESVSVPSYDVRVSDGLVQVGGVRT